MEGFLGVGPLELLLVAVLALIFIGPERLPGVIRQVVRLIQEVRSYADELRADLGGEFADVREELTGLTQEVNQVAQELASQANGLNSTPLVPLLPSTNEPAPAADLEAVLASVPPGASADGMAAADQDDDRVAIMDYRPGPVGTRGP